MADQVTAPRTGGNASSATSRTRNALDPRAPLLCQPFKRLVEEGIITELSVSFTPTGYGVSGTASERLVGVTGSGLNTTDRYPVARLAQVAELGNLIPKPGKKGKGVAQPQLPAKTLCKEDFKDGVSTARLQQRANAVASAVGGGPLVGRVRSAGRFTGTESQSYQDWWTGASPEDRALSLCQGRHLSSLTEPEKAKLVPLQCPFRGTLEFTVSAHDEEED